jgi:hypothetical protein
MKDMMSNPKSSLLYSCATIFQTTYKCFHAGLQKRKEEESKRVKEYLVFNNRFLYKSCDEDIKTAINNPAGITPEMISKPFTVREAF